MRDLLRRNTHNPPTIRHYPTHQMKATAYWIKPFSLILLSVLFCFCRNSDTKAADIKRGVAAIISGRGDFQPNTEVIAAIERLLLTDGDIELVERAEIERILAEHRLNITDSSSRVQLGQLVSADVLVFLDGLPQSQPHATRIQIVETRTGVIWTSWMEADETIIKDGRPLADAIKRAVRQNRSSFKKRHVVGILDIRNEESGNELDSWSAACGALLAMELGKGPDIVVLDRDHLDHLTMEKTLTSMEQELKGSLELLECGIRRTGGGQREVTVVIRPMTGGFAKSKKVNVFTNDLCSSVVEIIKATAVLLNTQAPNIEVGDTKREAEMFAQQAKTWDKWHDPEKAVRAAETAFALDPSQKHRLLLIGLLLGNGWQSYPTLQQCVRGDRLILDYYRINEAELASGIETNKQEPITLCRWPLTVVASADLHANDLVAQFVDLEEQIFRVRLERYRRNYLDDESGKAYWDIWRRYADDHQQVFTSNTDACVAFTREALNAFLYPPAQPDWMPWERFNLAETAIRSLAFDSWDKPCNAGARLELLFELRKHEDPCVCWLAYKTIALIQPRDERGWSPGGAQANLDALETFIEKTPRSHPAFEKMLLRQDPRCPPEMRQKACDLYYRFIDKVITGIDPDYLLKIHPTRLILYLDAVAEFGRPDDALVLADKIIEVLRKPSVTDLQAITDFSHARERYLNLCKAIPGGYSNQAPQVASAISPLKPPQTNDSGWNFYDFRPMAPLFQLTNTNQQLYNLFVAYDGTNLYCLILSFRHVNANPYPEFYLDMTINRMPSGELIRQMAIPQHIKYCSDLLAMALAPKAAYIGTTDGLIEVPLDGSVPRSLTVTDGLPGKTVRALGWFKDKLYIGIGLHPFSFPGGQAVLAEYDPTERRFAVLASERAVVSNCPLDGIGFQLDQIVPDATHDCLWLKDKETGLWQFNPGTKSFLHKPEYGVYTMIDGIHNQGLTNYFSPAQPPVVFFRPKDLSTRPLSKTTRTNEFVFGTCSVAFDGCDTIIASALCHDGRRQLFLVRDAQSTDVFDILPDGELLPPILSVCQTDAGVVAVSNSGRAFLIKRKKDNEKQPSGHSRQNQ